MKSPTKPRRIVFLAGALAIMPLCAALADDTNSQPAEAKTEAAAPAPVISSGPAPVISGPAITGPVKLPYGAEDVLKLSRAQVGEDVILNYVQSSGTIYNLTPKDIVYLKDQGVSEKVINAMLNQRKRAELAMQQTPSSTPSAAPSADNYTAPAQNGAAGPAGPGYADPNATYAEAPLTPPASSVYVIPYAGATYPYYEPYYPYYYGGWYGPSIALGFRFGGHGYYGRGFGGHGFGGHAFGGHGGHSGHR